MEAYPVIIQGDKVYAPASIIISLRARLAEVEAQRDGLKKLVMAVASKANHGPDDVDGKNWFDARDEALAKLEAHDGK